MDKKLGQRHSELVGKAKCSMPSGPRSGEMLGQVTGKTWQEFTQVSESRSKKKHGQRKLVGSGHPPIPQYLPDVCWLILPLEPERSQA